MDWIMMWNDGIMMAKDDGIDDGSKRWWWEMMVSNDWLNDDGIDDTKDDGKDES